MVIDLEILSVQQFVSAEPSWVFENCVGSTHFDSGTTQPDGSVVYNYENLWLRYKLNIPRRIKKFWFRANYGLALNGPEYVNGQRFHWSFGSEDKPGPGNPFYWDVDYKTTGLIEKELRLAAGVAWFWLTYDYGGQNNCYVKETELATLQGETIGSARIVKNGAFVEAPPYVSVGGQPVEGEAYVYHNGVWRPGI